MRDRRLSSAPKSVRYVDERAEILRKAVYIICTIKDVRQKKDFQLEFRMPFRFQMAQWHHQMMKRFFFLDLIIIQF